MSKKLMLLAAGALTALAFAALPVVASAGEFTATCENGSPTCEGTITGTHAELRNDNKEGITCTGVAGNVVVTNNSATGTAKFKFTGCRENITIFHFTCSNTATAGEIETGAMVTHNIYLEPSKGTPGVKVTLPSTGVTFNCAGFAKKTVTGKVIGEWDPPNCGTFQSTSSVNFTELLNASKEHTPGVQTWMQATTTGETTDLISNNDAGGAYTTSAQSGTGTIHWTGTKVKLNC